MRPSTGSGSALHRTIWFTVGLTLAFSGLYVLVAESFIKHDAVNDLFVPKSMIILYSNGVSVLGGVMVCLALFFQGLTLWKSRHLRRRGASYEAVHD